MKEWANPGGFVGKGAETMDMCEPGNAEVLLKFLLFCNDRGLCQAGLCCEPHSVIKNQLGCLAIT